MSHVRGIVGRGISLPVFLKSDILKTCCRDAVTASRVGFHSLAFTASQGLRQRDWRIVDAIQASRHHQDQDLTHEDLKQDNHHAQAHVPTQPSSSQQGTRLSRSHGLEGRTSCTQPPSREGSSQDRCIRRLPRLVSLPRATFNRALTGGLPLSAFLCSARVATVRTFRLAVNPP